jgi:hypothetical protein
MSTKNYITFSDLYTSEYTLTDIYAECQKWTDGSCFSRLDRPRKVSALIFLNGCSGTYTNSRGEVFHAAQKSFVCLPQSSKYSVLNLTSGAAFPDAFLIEFNIIKDGAPIDASDITEIGIKDVEKFANEIMKKYADEVESIKNACYKVRGV